MTHFLLGNELNVALLEFLTFRRLLEEPVLFGNADDVEFAVAVKGCRLTGEFRRELLPRS